MVSEIVSSIINILFVQECIEMYYFFNN